MARLDPSYRRARLWLSIGLLMAGLLLSVVPTGHSAEPVPNRPDLPSAWEAARQVALNGKVDVELGPAIRTLIVARDAQGLHNLEAPALALSRWAREASLANEYRQAEVFAQAAILVAPGVPEGYLSLSSVYWKQHRIPLAIAWMLKAAAVGVSHPWVGLVWMSYGVIVFWLAAATCLVVFLIPGLKASLVSCHHLVQEAGGLRVPGLLAWGALLALLALPFAADWGIGWVVLIWAMVAWAGDRQRLRKAQVVLLVGVLLGPWMVSPMLAISEPNKGLAYLAMKESQGALTPQVGKLPKEGHQGGWQVAFALGNGALRAGQYDQAIGWYARAQDLGGDPIRIAHNVATARFRSGQVNEAYQLFLQISKGDKVPVETLYNLGQTQSRMLDFDGARISFDRARQIDADGYLRVSRVGNEDGKAVLVPMGLTNIDSRTILLSSSSGWNQAAVVLWQALFGGVPPLFAPVLLLLFTVLTVVLARLQAARRVIPCDFCHTGVCQKCMSFVGDLHLCRSCGDHLGHSEVSPLQVAIARDRFRFVSRIPWHLAARLIPGVQEVQRQRYGRATAHLMLFAFMGWWVVLLGTIPEWSVGVPQDGWPVARLAGGALLCAHLLWVYLRTGAIERQKVS